MGADADELTGWGKPLTMASRGNPLRENAAGNQDDDEASEHHAAIAASIGCGPFDAVDDQHLDRPALGVELEAKLLLNGCKDRRCIVGGARAG